MAEKNINMEGFQELSNEELMDVSGGGLISSVLGFVGNLAGSVLGGLGLGGSSSSGGGLFSGILSIFSGLLGGR